MHMKQTLPNKQRKYSSLKAKYKKFKTVYHLIVILITIGVVSVFNHLEYSQQRQMTEEYMVNTQDLITTNNEMSQIKIDSLTREIDHLRSVYSESAARSFQVTNAANIITEVRKKTISPGDAMRLAGMIYDAADRNGIKFSFLMAVIYTESRFNPSTNASTAGAKGLCQIMPTTFSYIARANGYNYGDNDIMDPYKNLRIGAIYLRDLMKRYNGSINMTAAGYNGGPRVAENYRKYAAGDTTVYIPAETLKYIASVQSMFALYRESIGD